MPVIHLTHDDLLAQDLAPYIELFQREDNMVKAVMVSHGGFPNIDIHRGIAGGQLVPASINHGIVTGLLREELGYDGLVVTDDLEMGAIARHSEIEVAALRAILAGEDMILVCARPDLIRRAYSSLLAAARTGELTRGRILASLRRIAAFKALTRPPLPFDRKRLQELSSEVAELNRKLNYVYGGKI
jgi:beta-N-acetylhexosaminidase